LSVQASIRWPFKSFISNKYFDETIFKNLKLCSLCLVCDFKVLRLNYFFFLLFRSYQVRGHLAAQIDPLNINNKTRQQAKKLVIRSVKVTISSHSTNTSNTSKPIEKFRLSNEIGVYYSTFIFWKVNTKQGYILRKFSNIDCLVYKLW
jgi:hypothetical protein